MNKEITTPEIGQADPTGVVLQQEKEGDTSSHLIAGLVAAEVGITLTANWLLSASVTSTTASLGYIGVAVFAWGTVSVLNSVPALLDSAKATEEDIVVTTRQNSDGAATSLERISEQAGPISIELDAVAQTETSKMAPVFHAETSLLAASVHTTAP